MTGNMDISHGSFFIHKLSSLSKVVGQILMSRGRINRTKKQPSDASTGGTKTRQTENRPELETVNK